MDGIICCPHCSAEEDSEKYGREMAISLDRDTDLWLCKTCWSVVKLLVIESYIPKFSPNISMSAPIDLNTFRPHW